MRQHVAASSQYPVEHNCDYHFSAGHRAGNRGFRVGHCSEILTVYYRRRRGLFCVP